MKVIIRMTVAQEAKALPILLRHSPGTILPGRCYILEQEAVQALRKARIKFTEVSRDPDACLPKGAPKGERV